MTQSDVPGSGSGNDVAVNASRPSRSGAVGFQSILFEQTQDGVGVEQLEQPDFFVDLNLDQVLESISAGRERYELKPLFYAPLHRASAVHYRHAVLRDLEKADVLGSVTSFADAMRRMRQHLDQVAGLHYMLQKRAWFLDAVEIYCGAVRRFAAELAEGSSSSPGFEGLCAYLAQYAVSERFASLATETQALKDALSGLRYAIRIYGSRVTVGRYGDEADYSAEVEDIFARFKQGAVASYLFELRDLTAMNHVEAQILDRVARLHPEVFDTLADYCARHGDYLDVTIGRFDREIQFYLAYLELIGPLEDCRLAAVLSARL